MQNRKSVWYAIAVTSLISLFILGSGAVLAIQDSIRQPANKESADQAPPKNPSSSVTSGEVQSPSVPAHSAIDSKEGFRILALGDSLTRGMGDETGQGYVGYLTRELQKTTQARVTVTNLGINGMKSPELLEYIQSPEVQKEIKAAHLITLSIGGNDLTHGVGTIATPNPELAKETQEMFLTRLDQILKQIRSQNDHAPLMFIGLYNPFPFSGDHRDQALQLLEEWNLQTSQILRKYPKTILVPTLDLFTWNGDALLAADHFHPNGKGYKAIAERILQDLQ